LLSELWLRAESRDVVKPFGLKVNILSEKEAHWGYWLGVQVNPEGGVVGY
jgi:hypothetical protein